MKVIAENKNRIMVVDDNVHVGDVIDEIIKCVVYNTQNQSLSDRRSIGSWTARIFPWTAPSRNYDAELRIIDNILKERNDHADGR